MQMVSFRVVFGGGWEAGEFDGASGGWIRWEVLWVLGFLRKTTRRDRFFLKVP